MFLQMIEQRTTQIDAMLELEEEWRASSGSDRTLRRSYVARDRNDPTRYFVLAFFDDEESARQNSDIEASQDFADRQSQFLLGLPNYTDLDVIKAVEY